MSRIGLKPIPIVSGVKLTPAKHEGGTRISVEGPKGKLSYDFRGAVVIDVQPEKVLVTRSGDTAFARAYHGTARALIANMVHGVTEGFRKRLDIVGVGYNAKLEGKKVVLQIGFSHPVEVPIPDGITVEIPSPTTVVVNGSDKQVVGEFSAGIRRIRPPEPYKGKGIRYSDEQVTRKAGKTFGSGD
jgi:large subunit ribosomal protein L6